MAKILVTGGAGFIGSHLCEALLARGEEVLCLDNFCDFYDPGMKHKNLVNCYKESGFSLIKADIRDADAITRCFRDNEIVSVLHLAAMAGVRPSIQNPRLYYEVNVLGTLNLLQACVAHNIDQFVFASSSSVFGNSNIIPFKEDTPVDHPISPYAATKKAGELMCYNYHYLYGLSICCLRLFTVYGPRQRPDLAIHKFASLMKEGKALPVFGDGSSQRDYTYVSDLIKGILAALDFVRKNHIYEIINLGESRSISLNEMISTLESVSGIQARRQMLPAQPGDVSLTYADISKAKRLLGYSPDTDFRTGIEQFWDWFSQS
ncbi:MAG: GDP-mannose 4,6-dehydratase [Candidatus Cloacimonetes bacterium]|nr:GDP-mannose 4,6-dehydratase [Candidatus Cloacimonadota bacterium]